MSRTWKRFGSALLAWVLLLGTFVPATTYAAEKTAVQETVEIGLAPVDETFVETLMELEPIVIETEEPMAESEADPSVEETAVTETVPATEETTGPETEPATEETVAPETEAATEPVTEPTEETVEETTEATEETVEETVESTEETVPEEILDSVKAPEGYVSGNGYLSETFLAEAAEGITEELPRVLLIEDVLPWNSYANQEVLSGITEYDKVTTSEFLSVDLEKYGVVVFANDQPFNTYENYADFKEYLEVFANIGGVIVFGACDAGWAGGNMNSALPGNVTKRNHYEHRNYVVDHDHPIVTGILTDNIPLVDSDLYSNYCSHISFDESSLPAGTTVILRETSTNKPTLIEYPLGKGRVIASGLTWEHNMNHGSRDGYGDFAKRAMADMFTYAIRVSSIEVDELFQLEDWRYNTKKHSIVVADASGDVNNLKPVAGAQVVVGGVTYESDISGQVFTDNFGLKDISVKAENYRELKTKYYVTESSGRILFLEKAKSDGLPYLTQSISTTGAKDVQDLRYEAMRFTEGNGKMLITMFDGNWNGNGAGYYRLYQNATATSDGVYLDIPQGNFINISPGKKLMPNVPVWVKMVASNGVESEPVQLKLYIDSKPLKPGEADNRLEEGSGSIAWLESKKLSTDNKLITDYLMTDLSISTELIPIEVSFDTNVEDGSTEVKVAIGIAAGSAVKNLLNSKSDAHGFKKDDPWKQFQKMYKDYAKNGNLNNYFEKMSNKFNRDFHGTRFRSFVEGKVEVGGYWTYKIDKYGDIIEKPTGGIAVKGDGKLVFGRTVFVHGVPLFFEVNAGGKVEFETELKALLGRLVLDCDQVKFTLPYADLFGGVGVRGVATLGVGGGLDHTIELSGEKSGGYVTADAFFDIKILFLVNERVSFIESEPFLRWGDFKQGKAVAARPVYAAGNNLTLASRDYLKNASQWNGNPVALLNGESSMSVLQYGVMPEAMPEVHQIGDKLVMLYLQDNADRAIGNHTQLMYSVFEYGTWSYPAAVWESDSADFFFDSTVVDNQLYVAWQKSGGVLDSDDPQVLLDAAVTGSEICLATWDNESNCFTQQQMLTNNQVLDMMPAVSSSGSDVLISWVSNADNNVLEATGTYKINQVRVSDGIAGAAKKLYETEQFVGELVADGSDILFTTVEADSSTSIHYLKGGSAKTLMEGCGAADVSSDNGMFLIYADETLYEYDPASGDCNEIALPDGYPASAGAQFVIGEDAKALVWAETGRIVSSIYSDGAWQKPVTLASGIDEEITFLDVALMSDGQYAIVANTALYNDAGECDNTTLSFAVVPPVISTALLYADVDAADWDSNTQEITVKVENTGMYAVDQMAFTVSDNNYVYLDKYVDVNLQPGESVLITEEMDISDVNSLTRASVNVYADGEYDVEDNYAEAEFGYIDASLALDSYEYDDSILFVLTAHNTSNIPANSAISVIEDSVNGIVLDVKDIGAVSNDENIQYVYTLDKTKINFGGSSTKNYFFALDTLETDWFEEDNICSFSVSKPSDVVEIPDGEMNELSLVDLETVTIQNGNLTFYAPDDEPVYLTAVITPEDALVTDVTWSVEDDDIVSINSSGKVIPLRPGTTKITATAIDGVSDTITVTVKNAVHAHEAGESWYHDGLKHWQECGICQKPMNAGDHSGGTATCTVMAVCEVCDASYGQLEPHDYEEQWQTGDKDGHWHNCKNCTAHGTPVAHTVGQDGLCTVCGGTVGCGYALGDVNHDNKINAKDATLILQKSVGVLKESAKFCEECAEVSSDGKLNAKDSTLILQFSVGLRSDFPGQK